MTAMIQPMTKGRKKFKILGPHTQIKYTNKIGITILRIRLQYLLTFSILITHYMILPKRLPGKRKKTKEILLKKRTVPPSLPLFLWKYASDCQALAD